MTARFVDHNGYMTVENCPISRVGVFDYTAGSIGAPGDPDRIVKVFRPESTLSEQACIDSFRNVPIINDHEFLGSQADGLTPAEKKGVEGIVCEDVHYQGGYLRATLKVFSESMKRLIASGKDDLSCGYLCEYVPEEGTWNGQSYEYKQVDMRGNHLALVDQARCSGSRVLDSAEKPAGKGVFTMDSMEIIEMSQNAKTAQARRAQAARAKAKGMDSAVDQIKELIGPLSEALEQFFTEEGSEPAHQEGADPAAAAGEGGEGFEDEVDPAATAGVEGENPSVEREGDEDPDAGAASGGDKKQRLVTLLKSALAALEGEGAAPAGDEEAGDPERMGDEEIDPEARGEDAEAETDCEETDKGGHSGPRGTAGVGADSAVRRKPTPGRKPQAMDAAAIRRSVFADIEKRDDLYGKVSKYTGAFKYKGMDSVQVAQYAAKALKLNVVPGHEVQAIDSYLAGRAAGAKTNPAASGVQQVGDGIASNDVIDAYLKG
ncbi:head maturation protease [Burkholderia phage Bm1]